MKKQIFPLFLLLSLSAGKISATTLDSNPFSEESVSHASQIVKNVEEVVTDSDLLNPFSEGDVMRTEEIVTYVEESVDNALELTDGVKKELSDKTSEVYASLAEKSSKVAGWIAEKASKVYEVGSEKASEAYTSVFDKTAKTVVEETQEIVEEVASVVEVPALLEDIAPAVEEVAPALKELTSTESQTSFSDVNQTIDEFLEETKSFAQDTTTDSWKTWASDKMSVVSEKASNGVSYVAGKSSDLHATISDKVAGTRFEGAFNQATCRPSVNAVGALTGASVFYNVAKKLKGNAFVKGLSSLTGAGLGAVSAPAAMAFIESQVDSTYTNVAVGLGALSVIGASFYLGRTTKEVATK